MSDPKPVALIIGVGDGLSASLARDLWKRGYQLVLAARNADKLKSIADETGGVAIACDSSSREDMAHLFEVVDQQDGALSVAIYNPSARQRGPIAELDPQMVENALAVTAYGAFLMAHHGAKRMLKTGSGSLLFTGASAGVKGFANSAPFAMGKFALRGLCQSLARELHPKGIHVGHFVIDGGIANGSRSERHNSAADSDDMLDPGAISQTYMAFLDQHRSAWAWEIEVRPWVERF